MSDRQPFQYVEIDMDYCSLSYGSSPCAASLGTTGAAKCFNTFKTCQDQGNFARETKTIRLCEPLTGIPAGELFFPCVTRFSAQSSSVNIGGADKRLNAFGRRAKLTSRCREFAYHDRFFDKYQPERISGAALSSGAGYNPQDTGTFFARLLSRWPYYPNRAIRLVDAYLDGGVITVTRTRNYILSEIDRDGNGSYTIEARDPLDLAANTKAVAPQPVNGVLAEDINANADSFTLSPAGIGDIEYPATGRALIGSELVSFTRVADVCTFTGRGLSGSDESTHSAGDNVQTALSYDRERVDVVVRDLLVNFAGIDPAFIPDATWAAEIERWASIIRITTDIIKPEGVNALLGEIAELGFSVWWDDVNQLVGLKTIRPPDSDTVFDLTDDNAIKKISIEARDDDRATEVYFSSVLRDPTQNPKESRSYLRSRAMIDAVAKSPNAHGDTRIREINCRLLNQGADSIVRMIGLRALNRYKVAPSRYILTLDAKDAAIGLTDVLRVTSDAIQGENGEPIPTLMQVVKIEDDRPGHDFTVVAQSYEYEGRFGFCMQNSASTSYDTATVDEKEAGNFAVDENTLIFSDGTGPYVAI